MAKLADFANRPCPAWFAQPQLGVFIHWGVFAIPAWAPPGRSINNLMSEDYDNSCTLSPYAEWYMNAMAIPESPTAQRHRALYGERPYEAFRPEFEEAARAFDANAWARVFAAAGARYVVFVTKHHDGYCLWPSAVENPMRPGWRSPRDFVGELAKAVRAQGMRFGVYYSGGLDWTFRHEPIRNFGDMLACVPTENAYRAYAGAQIRELIERYEPSLVWNDIAWPDKADVPDIFQDYYARVPDGVVNDRWYGQRALFESLRDGATRASFNAMIKARVSDPGARIEAGAPPHCDFRTVEYGMGEVPADKKWEACRGVGLAFGYNQAEAPGDFLNHSEFIAMRDDVLERGGNLLINVGPCADASIPEVQRRALLGP